MAALQPRNDDQLPEREILDIARDAGSQVGNLLKKLTGTNAETRAAAAEQGSLLDSLHRETLGSLGEKAPRAPIASGRAVELDPKAEDPRDSRSVYSDVVVPAATSEEPVSEFTQPTNRSILNINHLINLLREGKIEEFNQHRPSGQIDLHGLNLANLDLRGVDLRGAILTRAILTGCDLNGALFQKSTLDYADLRRTTINDAKFFEASLRHCDLSGVTEAKRAQFNNCNLRAADLSASANFSGADFSGAKLITANLTDSSFKGCQMTGVWLAGAILTNTNFVKANLHQARLFQANGLDVNFSEANLTQAEATQTHFTSSNKKSGETVTKTNFDGAWTMGFQHNGAITENLLSTAISDKLPAEGQFKSNSDIDQGKILINGIPGTDKVIYDAAMEELNELIGLKDVKVQIQKLTAVVEVNQARKRMELPVFKNLLHRVYKGQPGTGKTTVARIEGQLYYALGLLNKGQVIETDKSGLISGFAGQSLGKTQDIVDSALGGTLILDEIYALTETKNDDYAKDVVTTLVKRLWDDRDKFCCILLGYGQEMDKFIDSNRGLRRRIGAIIEFPAYSSGELIDIFKLKMDKQKLNYTRQILAEAAVLFMALKFREGENFGNAGSVENSKEQLQLRLSCRLKATGKVKDEKSQLNPIIDDIPFYEMSNFNRSELPKISELNWLTKDGTQIGVEELPLEGEFPCLSEASLQIIQAKVREAIAAKENVKAA